MVHLHYNSIRFVLIFVCIYFLASCQSFIPINKHAYIEFNTHTNLEIVLNKLTYEFSKKPYTTMVFFIKDANTLEENLSKIKQIMNKIDSINNNVNYHVVSTNMVDQSLLLNNVLYKNKLVQKLFVTDNLNKIVIYFK